jgi:LIVCS family branched-chain amino acid:cation transporter
MKTTRLIDTIAAGMAIFAMYFGAGNIIFPLAIGQIALDKTSFALVGFLIAAVILPFAGLLTMFLFQGHIATFFSRIGKIPGLLLASFCISLLGPLGCSPRCIVLSHSTLSLSFPGIPLILFSLICSLAIFLFVYKPGKLLSLIGYVLSPFKILLLVGVILVGIIGAPDIAPLLTSHSGSFLVFHGLVEGYNTLDLIGSFFFAPIILVSLLGKEGHQELGSEQNAALKKFIFKACGIAAVLLSTVYVGFCYLAYLYAPQLVGVPSDQLLGAIAIQVLGSYGGIIVSLTVTVACLTTAIALTAAFASFVQKEIFLEKVGYIPVALGSVFLTFLMTILGFEGIMAFLVPVLKFCYPVLIALTFYNLVVYFLEKRSAQKRASSLRREVNV